MTSKEDKMPYEMIGEEMEYKESNPFHFLKWAAKYNILKGVSNDKIKFIDDNEFKKIFPFANPADKVKYKSVKKSEFALAWFKDRIKQSSTRKKYKTYSKGQIEILSGVISEDDALEPKLKEFIGKFIPYSFILHARIKLTTPYFSKDDDNFYLIQNPCLKEKVFKVPMVRGSGWKGAIAKAGKELINEDMGYFESYIRIFGAGSNEYRELINGLDSNKGLKNKVIEYLLFELGKRLKKEDIEQINSNPKEYLQKLARSKPGFDDLSKVPYLQPHKGRAIFYPTYFDSFSLEVINPHSRKTRAGTNPIHYEVVPKGEEGVLQIVYIPFDGILTKTDELKKQIEQDIAFLTKALEKAADIGIGAKGKLGWGRFELKSKSFCANGKIKLGDVKNWKQCEVDDEQQ